MATRKGTARVEAQEVSTRVWTVPNVISMVRLALVPVFAVLVAGGSWWWAIVVLAVCGASDWADGFLARRLRQVTRLGQVLDPVADRVFIMVTIVAFALAGVAPWWLVAAILAREVFLAVFLPLLARAGYGPLPVSYIGKAGTFALMCAFPLLLAAQVAGPATGVVQVVAWAFAGWGAALYWAAGISYAHQAVTLLRAART